MNRLLPIIAFLAGLLAVGWIGAGYIGGNPLALSMTLLITVFYLLGAWELYRYHRDTLATQRLLDGLSETPDNLPQWLGQIPTMLRQSVRLRIEGERVGLPGPALTPYLAGLLVLLGMLGTFLGMVVTLRGTGMALAQAADLQAIRASLAAPVQGLGFAFGTSIAGVATSAMLGLMSALCRRERQWTSQSLDAVAATVLRPYSQSWQRDESFRMLQQQASLMPALVDRLQDLAVSLEQHGKHTGQSLAEQQQVFHTKAEAAYVQLAGSVEQSLRAGVEDGARAAGAAIQPAVEALQAQTAAMPVLTERLQGMMEALERLDQDARREQLAQQEAFHARTETAHARLTESLEQQLSSSVAESIKAAGAVVAPAVAALQGQAAVVPALSDKLQELMAALENQGEAYRRQLLASQDTFHAKAESLQQQLAAMLEEQLKSSVSENAQAAGQAIRPVVDAALETLTQDTMTWRNTLAETVQQQLAGITAKLESSTDTVSGIWNQALDQYRTAGQENMQALQSLQTQFVQTSGQQVAEVLASVAQRLEDVNASVSRTWEDALIRQAEGNQVLADENRKALADAAAAVETHVLKLLSATEQANAELRTDLQSGDEARLAAWSAHADSITSTLQTQWTQAAAQVQERQEQICATLEQAAANISSNTAEQSQQTIAEIRQLMQAAAEAPKAAADVIAQLRAQISDGMARDNAVLEERGRMLETVETLLNAVNHAATEQRTAIDALVTTSSDLLDRVGTQFAQKVEQEAGKLAHVASQVTGSAVEVASLGEALGTAVQRFGESSEALGTGLQRIEEALEKAGARSDEQLAYYVAQAREVVDLTLMSQKQILEELQRAALNSEAQGEAKS